MRNKTLAIAALIALAATGCTSYEERVANTCARLGAPMGSEGYWPCVRERQAIDAADRASWGAVTAAGASILAAPSSTRQCYFNGSYGRCW